MGSKSTRTALLALLVVTIIWGWTFSWMKEAIDTATAQLGDALPLIVGFTGRRFLSVPPSNREGTLLLLLIHIG